MIERITDKQRLLDITLACKRPGVIMATIAGGFGVFAALNAVYWQDNRHPAEILALRANGTTMVGEGTDRDLPRQGGNVTRIVYESQSNTRNLDQIEPAGSRLQSLPPSAIATQPPARPVEPTADNQQRELLELQTLLSQLGFYAGEIDGKTGPKTRAAIAAYKQSAGLDGIELTNAELVTSAQNNLLVTAAIPVSRPPAPTSVQTVVYRAPDSDNTTIATDAAQPDTTILKVQNALRTYAGEHIAVDGVVGPKTREAISEFQSVFKLDVTGQIDQTLIDKMVDVGLIDE